MNEKEYLDIGTKKRLPLRCPILNYCARRAYTIYFNSEYDKYSKGKNITDILKKAGDIPDDYEAKKIEFQGEAPSWIRGRNHFYFSDMCPEVNLFDKGNSLCSGVACTEGDYDIERRNKKINILKTKHYSECAEFNMYQYEQGLVKKGNRKNGNRFLKKYVPFYRKK